MPTIVDTATLIFRGGIAHLNGVEGEKGGLASQLMRYIRGREVDCEPAEPLTGGHTIDALCHCLGEFRELAAFVVGQRDRIPLEEAGELIAKTSPDQLVVNGIVGGGAVVSFQIRGGMNRGTAFLFVIHGEEGDLQLTATSPASMQRQELNMKGARGDAKELVELAISDKYRWVPAGFDAAVTRHRLIDAIMRASETGMKQVA